MKLETCEVECPYCGETIELEVEVMEEEQSFVQDCPVCCRPIQYKVTAGADGPEIDAGRSD